MEAVDGDALGFFLLLCVALIFALWTSPMNPAGFFLPLSALLMAALCSTLRELRRFPARTPSSSPLDKDDDEEGGPATSRS